MSDKKLELTNLDTCDSFENCLIHVYRGLVADKQFFLVENQLYEGSHTRVFSRKTGDEYEVFATPHVSPDGKFLVTASDSEAGQAGVFLWAISEGALTPRFASNSKDYELFRFVRWDGSDKVELMKTIRAPDDVCKGKLIEFPVRLAAREEEWKLEGTFEKDKMVCNP
jgi:hypothetical protein